MNRINQTKTGSNMGKNNLKELRKSKKITQKELADFLNIKQNTYSYWENGTYDIDNESLQKLANYYDVSIDYILKREQKEITSPFPDNTVVSIGRGGKRTEYQISDEDAAIVDAFLEKMSKKN